MKFKRVCRNEKNITWFRFSGDCSQDDCSKGQNQYVVSRGHMARSASLQQWLSSEINLKNASCYFTFSLNYSLSLPLCHHLTPLAFPLWIEKCLLPSLSHGGRSSFSILSFKTGPRPTRINLKHVLCLSVRQSAKLQTGIKLEFISLWDKPLRTSSLGSLHEVCPSCSSPQSLEHGLGAPPNRPQWHGSNAM